MYFLLNDTSAGLWDFLVLWNPLLHIYGIANDRMISQEDLLEVIKGNGFCFNSLNDTEKVRSCVKLLVVCVFVGKRCSGSVMELYHFHEGLADRIGKNAKHEC